MCARGVLGVVGRVGIGCNKQLQQRRKSRFAAQRLQQRAALRCGGRHLRQRRPRRLQRCMHPQPLPHVSAALRLWHRPRPSQPLGVKLSARDLGGLHVCCCYDQVLVRNPVSNP